MAHAAGRSDWDVGIMIGRGHESSKGKRTAANESVGRDKMFSLRDRQASSQ